MIEWRIGHAVVAFLVGLLGAIVGVLIVGPDPSVLELLGIVVPLEQVATIGYLVWRAEGLMPLMASVRLRFLSSDWKWVFGGIGVQIAIALAITLPIVTLFGSDDEQAIGQLVTDAVGAPEILASFVVIVLAAPLVEEILFRGVLYSALRRSTTRTLAWHLQAVVFAISHLLDPAALFAVPGLYVAGLVLGWAVDRTQRLGPAVALHAGFNLLGWVALATL